MTTKSIIPAGLIEQRIFIIRGLKVMIDRDLAELYGVETKHLNRQVKRNKERFPSEFMFKLTKREKHELVTNWHRFSTLKHSSVLPYVFTEHGVAMLATVLKSERAVCMSILIIKAFVHLRELITSHKELAEKFKLLEERIDQHDEQIKAIIETIRHLLEPPVKSKRPIGFRVEEPKAKYAIRKQKKIYK
ncbi:MAG: ORF6N domain-containing protein [Bacteroidota bacterium]|nr:ORF6N domain-containing protein [Bacteroidota bacterium]